VHLKCARARAVDKARARRLPFKDKENHALRQHALERVSDEAETVRSRVVRPPVEQELGWDVPPAAPLVAGARARAHADRRVDRADLGIPGGGQDDCMQL
jgi:hypothetical protein